MEWLKRAMIRWLRLPPDPHPPAGSGDSARVFRAAPNYYRYALARWGLRQAGVLIGVLFVLGVWQPFHHLLKVEMSTEAVDEIRDTVPMASWADRLHLVEVRPVPNDPERVAVSFGPALLWFEMFAIALFLLQLPLTYTLVRLDYELRWYIVTDSSLRTREGITSLWESTMTFANIQNLTIEQGPIQRLLAIADLRVRTAGGGSDKEDESSGDSEKSKSMHIGYLRGVDNAPELRDMILAHLQRLKTAGLGDSARLPAVHGADGALRAARAVLEEARAMRSALTTLR
jgi:membrane protein YdbS with pleckstrin-like domain